MQGSKSESEKIGNSDRNWKITKSERNGFAIGNSDLKSEKIGNIFVIGNSDLKFRNKKLKNPDRYFALLLYYYYIVITYNPLIIIPDYALSRPNNILVPNYPLAKGARLAP